MRLESLAFHALPGGDIVPERFDDFIEDTAQHYPWLPASAVQRMVRAYGTRIGAVIGNAQGLNDMGPHLGGDLYSRELEYLVEHEFVRDADDALWRRSKLALHLDDASRARVYDWIAQRNVAA